MTIHFYLRRSKDDAGKQEFSIDTQRLVCRDFVEASGFDAASIVEHIDEGKSGDDFHSRAALRRMMASVKPGDVVICVDQSRLGRDAIEVTLVVRDLVRDGGCRLYYSRSGQQVQFTNAIDQAMTFIQGTGHQMELESIRARTREALRARVRAGRVAGGRCYGYKLERRNDESGRPYTTAIVDEEQAKIVRRIFREYLYHKGLKAIASKLNEEGVPAPMAGRRGTGSWSPGAVRVMLLNPRYRGLYVHGKVKRVRRGGAAERIKADPSEVLTREIPEWRIVDDETWLAVQEKFAERANGPEKTPRTMGRYALSGIARCETCGGPIGVVQSRHGKHERYLSYGCVWHHQRGATVCPVTIYQRTEEIEAALIDALQRRVLVPSVLDQIMGEVRSHLAARLPEVVADVGELQQELRSTKAEHDRFAKAIALSDDVGVLLQEMRVRRARIQYLESKIDVVRKTPQEIERLASAVEATAHAKLLALQQALARPEDRRQVFLALFPKGVRLAPSHDGTRQVWKISADAHLGELTGGMFNLRSDPEGTRTPVFGVRGRRPRPLDDGAMKLVVRSEALFYLRKYARSRWFGDKDSNLDSQIQSLASCHWTIPEWDPPGGGPLSLQVPTRGVKRDA